ncbi:MAG: SIMPL domain-containing protein [Ruminococcus sp.]|nr:SIMPL domain-containing protein [Ruminococcus sp.]
MGKIKISGSSAMQFEPDYCEFRVTVHLSSGTSGDTLSKGKYRTEEVLKALQEKTGIDIASVVLDGEGLEQSYRQEEGYIYRKTFSFRYQADNHITEAVTSLLENMADVEYSYEFGLTDRAAKEAAVMSAAIDDAKAKAENIAASLSSRIVGYEEIKYEFAEENDDDGLICEREMALSDSMVSLASELKNPKIEISKNVNIIWITE